MTGEHDRRRINRLRIDAATLEGKTAAEISTTASDHGSLTGLSDDDHPLLALQSQGLFAARPTAGRAGRLFFATDTGDTYWDDGSIWNVVAGSAGTDSDAIHDNVAGEIAALSTVTAASGDLILVEDITDSNLKKKVTAQTIADLGAGGADGNAIHVGTAAEIAAIAVKSAPVGADVVVIEDSADGWAKKQVTLSTVPGIPTQDVTGATTLDGTYGTVIAKFSSPATITLPAIDDAGIDGISYLIHHDGSANVTVAVTGTDVFRENGSSSGASRTLTAAGDNLAVTASLDSPDRWHVI